LKCDAGEGWRGSVGTDCVKTEVLHRVKEESNLLKAIKIERLTELVTSYVGTAFYNMLLKEK
jgi:hypothetical protein